MAPTRDAPERRRELEAELRRMSAALEASSAAFARFAYSVSHDLRAPIRALDGLSMILLEDYGAALDDDGRGHVRRIRDAARKLDRLVTDLHAYSRISSMPVSSQSVDTQRLVHEVVGRLDPAVSAPGAVIDVSGPLIPVRGDETLVREALAQLIGNALKFTPPGVSARVRVSSVASEDRVRLYVDDEGIGVPEAQRTRIFGVFERLHAEAEYAGTGMGLALVERIAERLAGATGVESNVPKGSRFWIELPAG